MKHEVFRAVSPKIIKVVGFQGTHHIVPRSKLLRPRDGHHCANGPMK